MNKTRTPTAKERAKQKYEQNNKIKSIWVKGDDLFIWEKLTNFCKKKNLSKIKAIDFLLKNYNK